MIGARLYLGACSIVLCGDVWQRTENGILWRLETHLLPPVDGLCLFQLMRGCGIVVNPVCLLNG